ncbi:pupal cuticle protein 36-like [Plodia interpunctella]|uniref:pupal cuticle protein 36-like n=1 Tax=Plodia interpunctella TaxID=58824 RepID=UPI002368B35F|nr:pupal cuticle protein 36-like [Plodia interpunctella]
MKLFVVAAILGACVADRLDNKYLPPRGNDGAGYSGSGFGGAPSAGSFGSGGFGARGSGFNQGGFGQSQAGFGQGGFQAQHSGNAYNAPNSRPQDAGAQILRLNSDVTADGFSYDFETSNGIRADASGVATNGVQSHGSFGYKGDDGQDYSITYTADENGYQPQGAHLPTPPPIPEEILRSLEQNARDEAAGISDDGSYRGEGAGAGGYSGSSAGGYSGSAAGSAGYSRGPSGSGSFGSGSGFGGQGSGFGGQGSGFGGQGSGFGGQGSGFGGSSGFGSKAGFGGSNAGFNNAASRQYLAPNAGPRPSGTGNFNAQSGYKY